MEKSHEIFRELRKQGMLEFSERCPKGEMLATIKAEEIVDIQREAMAFIVSLVHRIIPESLHLRAFMAEADHQIEKAGPPAEEATTEVRCEECKVALVFPSSMNIYVTPSERGWAMVSEPLNDPAETMAPRWYCPLHLPAHLKVDLCQKETP